MAQVSLDEAHRRLEELVAAAPPARRARRAGAAKGAIVMADDFDAPLPDFDA